MIEEHHIKNWWEENSINSQKDKKISIKNVHYGPFSADEEELKLLGNIKNINILELGCSGGQSSIVLSKKDARCTALDISQKQIEFPKSLSKNNVNIDFLISSYQDLKNFKTKTFDRVLSSFGFQFSPDLKKLFSVIYRVLKKKGILFFSLDHPFFPIVDENKSYYDPAKYEVIERWPKGSLHKFIIFRRNISDILNPFSESELLIEKVLEPKELNKVTPWNKDYDIESVKRIAKTLIIKAKKL